MSKPSGEAFIVLGGGLDRTEELSEKVTQRMDVTISEWQEATAPYVTISGGHSFLARKIPTTSEATVMKQYAIDKGVPESDIFIEECSLDTVGNALFTKTNIVIPNGWEHLIVVTSSSHLPRAVKIFEHVFGNDFEIRGIPAPEQVGIRERVWETLGSVLVNEVLRGTKPGDNEAIQERLFDLIPGYGDSTLPRLAIESLLGLSRKSHQGI